MRIGLDCAGYGLGLRGGVQVYLRELLRALDAHDGCSNEYTLLVGPEDDATAVQDGTRFRVVRLNARGRSASAWARRLATMAHVIPEGTLPPDPTGREIDALGLDVVHCPASRPHPPRLRTPVVVTFFDMQEEFLPRFFPVRERVARSLAHRRSVQRARVVIAPSRFTAWTLETRYGLRRDRIVVAGVGVHARFQPEAPPGERQALASRYGLPADGFVFYPAHPWPHKNHRRLFRALRLLTQRRGRRIPIVCTGTLGDESRILRRIAAAAGLPPEQLHDLGFVSEEEMPALYRAARLLVFPSLFEGFGMPVLEAMASGCPVACADTPALKELGGDAVAVFTGQSEMEMVEVLGRLWLDARARARLAESGLRRAVQFRWPAVVPQVLTAYRQAAAAPASRVGARVASGGAAR